MNNFLNQFPYSDFHEMNLDWILKRMKELAAQMNDFEAVNSISYEGIWDISKQYAPWSIVLDNTSGYLKIAAKVVPAGININNDEYWILVSPFKIDVEFDASSYNAIANKTVTDKFTSNDSSIAALQAEDIELNNKATSLRNDLTEETSTRSSQFSSLNTRLSTAEAGLNTETAQRIAADNVLNARISEIASLPEGSTSGDAELADIRVGENGITYPSAGDAVRGQIDWTVQQIRRGIYAIAKDITWIEAYVALNGTVTARGTSHTKDQVALIALNAGESIYVGTSGAAATTLFGTTSADSIDIGDTITPLLSNNSNNYLDYVYTATSNVNVVVSVNSESYQLLVGKPTSTQEELTEFKNEVDPLIDKNWTTGSVTAANHFINLDVDIKEGQLYDLEIDLDSGSSSDCMIYLNNTQGSSILTASYGTKYTLTAPYDITRIIGYKRADVSAYTTLNVKGYGQVSTIDHDYAGVETDVDNLEDRVEALEDDISILPSYAESMVDDINSTLKSIQTSESVSIGFITDIHVYGATTEDNAQYAMKVSKNALNNINRENPIDLCVLNGDYIYNDMSMTKANTVAWYAGLNKSFEGIQMPEWRGKGNHDINDIAGTTAEALTDEELYQDFLKLASIKDFVMEYGYLEKDYGYFDIPNKKIRCIFVNTSDIPYIVDESGNITYCQQYISGVSNRQLQFIANALKFDSPDWGVVFFSHFALQDNEVLNPTESSDGYLTPEHGGTPLMGIINAFINKTTYTYSSSGENWNYNINVDYSDNASDELIALVSGHNHRDALTTVDGYIMASSSAASYIYTGYDSEGNPYSRTPKTSTETSWDIITIDRSTKTFYMTRYGAGTDRSETYGS